MKKCQLAQSLGMQIIKALEEHELSGNAGTYLNIDLAFPAPQFERCHVTIKVPIFRGLRATRNNSGLFTSEYYQQTLLECFGWKKT